MRANVRAAWSAEVQVRRRRRAITWTVAGLAAAAVIAAVVSIDRKSVGPAPAPSTVARLLATTGPVQVESPGATAHAAQLGDQIPAGTVVHTADAQATFALLSGGEVRVDAGTAITFTGARALALERGGIYLDSGGAGTGLVVTTPAGDVRDIGTRFEVRVADRVVRVRVRDGRVALEQGSLRSEAPRGTELIAQVGGEVISQPISSYGPTWKWTTRAAPAFRVEGATLAAFLDWAAREGGRAITFNDPRLADAAATTVLHGSIEGLSIDDALTVILPTCGLTYEIQDDRVAIRRAKSSGA